MKKLDLRDRKIMLELDTDSSQSLTRIAKKLNLSKEVVAYRIKRLEEEGIIVNYITLSHFAKVGYIHFKLYIKYGHISEDVKKVVIDYLLKLDSIGWLASSDGIFDLMLSIRFRTVFEFEDFKDSFFEKYDSYFYRVEFAILTEAE